MTLIKFELSWHTGSKLADRGLGIVIDRKDTVKIVALILNHPSKDVRENIRFKFGETVSSGVPFSETMVLGQLNGLLESQRLTQSRPVIKFNRKSR